MKKLLIAGALILMTLGIFVTPSQAEDVEGENPPIVDETPMEFDQDFYRARVINILETGSQDVNGQILPFQVVEIEIRDDPEQGKKLTIDHGKRFSLRDDQLVEQGETVVIRKVTSVSGEEYEILDHYRLPGIGVFALGVLLLVVLIGGKRGALALASLGVSYWLLVSWVAPQILAGTNPFLISLAGALVIATVTMYLTHGFRRETSIALGAVLVSVLVAALLANRAVDLASLFGFGSEEAYSFQFGPYANLDFRGILLAGMVLGALGVLDDVATAQTATVEELKAANPKLSFGELYQRGLTVGRVHIASLVNTLVLAYAGAAFPLFLALVIGQAQPFWVTVNSEFFGEEIIRSLVGTAALILSVPIATGLSAWFIAKNSTNAN